MLTTLAGLAELAGLNGLPSLADLAGLAGLVGLAGMAELAGLVAKIFWHFLAHTSERLWEVRNAMKNCATMPTQKNCEDTLKGDAKLSCVVSKCCVSSLQ